MQFNDDERARTPDPSVVDVYVDLQKVVTPHFFGAGMQISAYPWWELTDVEWRRIFRRLEFMRVPLMRTMQSAFYYLSGADSQDCSLYDFDSIYQRKLRRLLDWCEEQGTRVILGEWGAPTDLAGISLANDDPRWARMIGDYLVDLFGRNEYRCVRYFNLINEPHGAWSTIAGRFDEWKRAIVQFRDELRRRGLTDKIAIAAPDADSEWLRKSLADAALCSAAGLFDIHWYATRDEISNGLVELRCRELRDEIARVDPTKPLVISELGVVDGKTDDDKQPNVFGFGYGVDMADAAIQLMRGGSAGFIAWYLDDAMHFYGDGEFVRQRDEPLPGDAYARRKVWGMWNILGDRMGIPEESQLRPWFYTWSLLSRYFPAGCRIVSAELTTTHSVSVAAAHVVQKGGIGISLAFVNRANNRQRVVVWAPELRAYLKLFRYDYFDQDADGRPDAWPRSADDQGNDLFPQPTTILVDADLQRGLPLELPGRGVTIVTSIDCGESMAA